MNRQDFMNRLASELARLPEEEIQAAMEYYNEYFDEAGPENEQQAIRDLGSPSKIATQIKADYAVRQLDEPGTKTGLNVFLWIVLGVFAAPVALPVAITLGVSAFTVFFSVLIVLICLIISLGAGCLGGALFVGVGIVGLGSSLSGGLLLIGVGLISAAVLALLCVGAFIGTKALLRAAARQMGKLRARRAKGGYKRKETGEDSNE